MSRQQNSSNDFVMAPLFSEAMLEQIVRKVVQEYSTKYPRPPCINQSQAAQMLGVSRPTIRKMLTDGRLSENTLGYIPISQIDALLEIPPYQREVSQTDPLLESPSCQQET